MRQREQVGFRGKAFKSWSGPQHPHHGSFPAFILCTTLRQYLLLFPGWIHSTPLCSGIFKRRYGSTLDHCRIRCQHAGRSTHREVVIQMMLEAELTSCFLSAAEPVTSPGRLFSKTRSISCRSVFGIPFWRGRPSHGRCGTWRTLNFRPEFYKFNASSLFNAGGRNGSVASDRSQPYPSSERITERARSCSVVVPEQGAHLFPEYRIVFRN